MNFSFNQVNSKNFVSLFVLRFCFGELKNSMSKIPFQEIRCQTYLNKIKKKLFQFNKWKKTPFSYFFMKSINV